MGGMSARFLDSKETRQMFQNDEIFQEILKGEKVDPKCIEIIYAGASSAAFTEIGTAMTAEFKGDAFEKTTVLCSTRVLTPGGSYFHIYVINSSAVITQYYIWFSKYEVFTVTCLAAAAINGTFPNTPLIPVICVLSPLNCPASADPSFAFFNV